MIFLSVISLRVREREISCLLAETSQIIGMIYRSDVSWSQGTRTLCNGLTNSCASWMIYRSGVKFCYLAIRHVSLAHVEFKIKTNLRFGIENAILSLVRDAFQNISNS
jgi:DNA-directed RNA polymerase subunit L